MRGLERQRLGMRVYYNYTTTVKQSQVLWTCLKKGQAQLGEKCTDFKLDVVRTRGTPQYTWTAVIEQTVGPKHLNMEDATD